MSMDGLLLSHELKELEFLNDSRLQKVNQIANSDFIFQIRSGSTNYKMLISLNRNYYHISLTDKEFFNPSNATMMTMLLRKHIEGGIIKEIYQYDLDRIVVMDIYKNNDFGDKTLKHLIIELMGKNSNMILTDDNYYIIDSFKHIGVSDSNRTILPKALYEFPKSNKINIYKASDDEIKNALETSFSNKDIVSKFAGFSPLMANHIINSSSPLEEIKKIKDTNIPAIYSINGKDELYFYPVGDIKKEYNSLIELIDTYFYDKVIADEVKEKSNNLDTHILHTLDKLKNKKLKLQEDMIEADNSKIYMKYGQLITSNMWQIKDTKVNSITLFDYETNQDITINLDIAYTPKENAKRFFTKYQKGRNAISYIEEQINKATEEISYLEIIYEQIKNASTVDIEGIKKELEDEHYIKKTDKKGKRSKEKIEILSFDIDGTQLLVGKNNLQNEIITHKISRPNELWFHVKDAPGSHVLLRKESNYTENEIRLASMIAAYYSKYQDSSSVPVQYTKARYVKKIPGRKACFVTFTEEKTIYIDPDKDIIDKLNKKTIELK